jgi:hypothetical protein
MHETGYSSRDGQVLDQRRLPPLHTATHNVLTEPPAPGAVRAYAHAQQPLSGNRGSRSQSHIDEVPHRHWRDRDLDTGMNVLFDPCVY